MNIPSDLNLPEIQVDSSNIDLQRMALLPRF